MGNLSWITRVGHKCNDEHSYKREGEGNRIRKEREQRCEQWTERFEDAGLEHQSDTAASQGQAKLNFFP